ncbi:MAG TPA: UvrD-helicase domain-containing protein [Steroidobacteraceae bacterium]|nr:UvrD-helicase domain-containing protein [Steroidobacteraceae bacterium]
MSERQAAGDEAARSSAADPARSVLLQAPAGSGKTAVLIQRYLRLLCTVDDPGEILAITFTRKAAAEMRARITRALRGELAATDPTAPAVRALAAAALEHGARRGWRLAQDPQALRIQTIDSFNFWLASELPVAARSTARLAVLDAPQPLYQRAARRTLAAADQDAELSQDAAVLFARLDNHWMNLERLIAQMLPERGHWLPFVVGADPQALCARVDAALRALLREQLAALTARLPAALLSRAAALPGVGPLGADPATLGHWQALVRLCFTQANAPEFRRRVSSQLGAAFTDPARCRALTDLIADLAAVPGARAALLGLRRAPPARLEPEDAAAIGALARVLRHAAAELHAEFRDAGGVDYAYLAGAARQALTELGEPTEFALRTGLALRHVLVDEFQDTSLAQVQLLEMLTVGWEPGDGRTLFVVGDPMQSVYRFRDAEVGLFLRTRDRGLGHLRLEALRLTRNFRTVPALVEFNNALFGAIFPPADDLRAGAVAYTPSIAALAPRPSPPGVPPVSLRLFATRAQEAAALAARIRALRQDAPHDSVAVLVTAHAHAVPLIGALEACGIATLGVDLVPLAERAVVRDLLSLARALFDLADRPAWLAVLRAPWCGLTLASLTALSGLRDREQVYEALGNERRLRVLAAPERARLARVRAVLGRALALRGAVPYAQWLEDTWLALGGADACQGPELADARAFLAALAARTAGQEFPGREALLPLIRDLCSEAEASGENPVQVMTVHRAKGLEFDHVFVPALERGHRGGERRLLRWADLPSESADGELVIAPAPPVGQEEGALQHYLRELFRERDAHERRRLLYVATTRARRTLWLSGAPPQGADGAVRPRAHTPLAYLWPALSAQFEACAAGAPAAAVAPRARLTRLRADWAPAPLPAAVELVHLPAPHLAAAPPEFSWVGETQRHIGTLVHRQLAELARGARLPAADAVAGEAERIGAELARLGVPERERATAAARVLAALQGTLADARGRWLLDSRARAAHSELALTGVHEGTLRSIVIDRSFIDDQGTRWVVDFKTSRHEGGGLEAFLAEELERYRGQLTLYAALARGLGPEPVRAALYFPLLREFRELPGA